MANSINLKDFIESISWSKSLAYNKDETDEEIKKFQFIEVVNGNVQDLDPSILKTNKIYLELNDKNIEENKYNLYVYVEDEWEQIDSLEFDIGEYYNKTQINNLLNNKSDITHGHNNATTTVDGFMSYEDKTKLDGVEEYANHTIVDSSLNTTSTNPVENQVVTTALNGKAPLSHPHGNITNEGTIGSSANKPVITTTGGKLTTGSFEATNTNIKMNGTQSVGSRNTFARGDHVHPSDTTKVDTAGTGLSKTGTTLNHSNNVTAQSTPVFSKLSFDTEGHITNTSNVLASDLPQHNHNTGEVSDTSAYNNIGSSANATQKTINNNINTQIGLKANSSDVYSKAETMTSTEIGQAIAEGVANLQLVEIVNSLPTSNIKTNRLYLTPNNENPSINENLYDLYIRVNNKWEQIDSLEFNIDDYYTKTQTDNLLDGKVNTTDSRLSDARTPTSHTHGNITDNGQVGSTANKPLITTTGGSVTTGNFETSTSNIKMNGTVSVGTSNNFARADHIHPSDTNKIDTGGTGLSKDGTTLNHSNSVTAQSTSVFKKIKYDAQGHITGTDSVTANDLPSSIPTSKITGLSTVATTGSYSDLQNTPSTFTPSTHTHSSGDVTGLTASKNVCTDANGKLSTENKNNHSHGSLASGGTLNSDASTVNKIAVTDGSNNLKTASSLDNTKIIEASALGTIGTNQNANQHTINDAINTKLNNIITGGVDLSGTHTHKYNQIDDLYDYNTGNNLLPYTKAFNIPAPTGSSITGVYRDCNVRYLQNTTSSYIDFAWTVPQSVLKPDTYYTISFWAKTSNEHEYFLVYFYNGNNQTTLRQKSNSTISGQETAVTSAHDGGTRFHLTTEWKRYYVVYKLNSTSITAGKQISLRLSPNTSINPDIYLAGVKLEIGDAPTPYCEMGIEDSGAEFIVGTQTESTGSWTGVSNTIYQLQKGTEIYYKLPYAGSGNATLNLTLANGKTTGAKECYYKNTTRLNTQYGVNDVIGLIYDGSVWRVLSPYYYANYFDRTYQTGQITMGEATATNVLVGGKTDGKYYKIVSGGVYDIRHQLYWTGGAFAINSVQSNIYSIFNSVNLQSTVSGLTVTNGKRVYIECSNYTNGQYIVSDRVFVSDDNLRVGYYYIPIGMSHSTTNIRFNTFTTDIYICESFGLKPYVEDDYLQSNFYLTDDLQLYVKSNNYYRSYTDSEDGLNDLLKPTNKTFAELKLTNTGLKINSSTSSEKWFLFPVINPKELQFTYVSGQLRGWLLSTRDASETTAICSGDCQSNTSYGIFIRGTRTAYTGTALASGDVIRVIFNNGVVSYYLNNVLIGSKEYDNSNDEVYCGFYTNNGRNLVVKDIIIK